MTNIEYLTSYVNQFVETIKQAGVKHIVMCPGSRSTPLAYGFAKSEGFAFYRQTDERSAGFFALGIAKATKEPVVLLCTSGTAAANFFPAIVEAFYARVPLLVVTADRPHELREVGAPQAIDQIHLFGKHVKWSVDFPLPEDRCRKFSVYGAPYSSCRIHFEDVTNGTGAYKCTFSRAAVIKYGAGITSC